MTTRKGRFCILQTKANRVSSRNSGSYQLLTRIVWILWRDLPWRFYLFQREREQWIPLFNTIWPFRREVSFFLTCDYFYYGYFYLLLAARKFLIKIVEWILLPSSMKVGTLLTFLNYFIFLKHLVVLLHRAAALSLRTLSFTTHYSHHLYYSDDATSQLPHL